MEGRKVGSSRSQDTVVNALDNLEARRYVDRWVDECVRGKEGGGGGWVGE